MEVLKFTTLKQFESLVLKVSSDLQELLNELPETDSSIKLEIWEYFPESFEVRVLWERVASDDLTVTLDDFINRLVRKDDEIYDRCLHRALKELFLRSNKRRQLEASLNEKKKLTILDRFLESILPANKGVKYFWPSVFTSIGAGFTAIGTYLFG